MVHGIGRTKGGGNTKVHAVCDAKGRPHVLLLTPGNVHDEDSGSKVYRRILWGERQHIPLLSD